MLRPACSRLAFAVCLMPTAFTAGAQETVEAIAPAFTFSANVSLVSQYRYRGLMQTDNKPAVQGGFDLAHSSGFYIGNWNSSIRWLNDSSSEVSAPVEMDLYAGYTRKIWGQLSVDAGVLHYYYPGSYPGGYTSPDTTEAYLGFGYGAMKFKYSHALTNLFGVPGSKNSQYYDVSGSFPTGVWNLNLDAHVGYQKVRNLDDGSYTDWSLGLSRVFNEKITVKLAYVASNAKREVYTNAHGRYLGGPAAVLSVAAGF